MGEINVRGFAQMEVECDTICYTFEFSEKDRKNASAVSKVNSELERFLSVLEQNGIKSEELKIVENSTNSSYYSEDDETIYRATRKIELDIKADSALINNVMNIIAEKDFNVFVSEQYICSKLKEYHEELLKSAIEDSRKKAEIIAKYSGIKIVGIKSVNTDDDYDFDEPDMKHCLAEGTPKVKKSKSDKLKNPTSNESESVNIIWLAE